VTAFLISRLPKILGATELANLSYNDSLRASCWNSSSSSGENERDPGEEARVVSSSIPRTRRYG